MTWGDLKYQVAYRLNRTDLADAFVEEMAYERVGFYGPQCFTPSEMTDNSITTQAGQYFYPLPVGTQQVNFVRVLFNGVWIPVARAERYTDILLVDPLSPPFVTLPVSLYFPYGNQLRLFPTPDNQYPVELTIMGTPPAPTNDGDNTNIWVQDPALRVLLINATMLEICREYLDLGAPNSPRIASLTQTTMESLEKVMQQAHMLTGPSVMKQWL